MRKKLALFALGIGIFLFFVFFSFLVHKDLFTNLDFNNTVRLQDHFPRRFDGFFSLFSLIGSFEVVSVVLLILIAVRRKISGILFFFFYIGLHFLELFGKFFVDHLPPPQFLLRTEKLAEFPQFYVRAENSYPSGHSARALFLTTLIFLVVLKNKKLSKQSKLIIGSFLLLYDITMLVSRVYLGEHWTSDVVGGSLLGLALALISVLII